MTQARKGETPLERLKRTRPPEPRRGLSDEEVGQYIRSLMEWMRREASAPQEQLLVQLADFEEEPFQWIPLQGLPKPWVADARYVLRDGRPVLRDLMIYVDVVSTDGAIPSSGLTSTMLRRLQLGPGAARGRSLAELFFREAGVPVESFRSRGLPRKARYTDDEVARFAMDYWKAGPVNPRRALLDKYGKSGRHVTDHEIAEWIRRAKDRGFLTRAKGQGDRSPRQPTDKLRAWAKANEPKRRRKKR